MSLQRKTDENVADYFEVYATTPFKLTLPGKGFEVGTDLSASKALPARIAGRNAECEIGEDLIATGKCKLVLRVVRQGDPLVSRPGQADAKERAT